LPTRGVRINFGSLEARTEKPVAKGTPVVVKDCILKLYVQDSNAELAVAFCEVEPQYVVLVLQDAVLERAATNKGSWSLLQLLRIVNNY
jgi:hypothetical protein